MKFKEGCLSLPFFYNSYGHFLFLIRHIDVRTTKQVKKQLEKCSMDL